MEEKMRGYRFKNGGLVVEDDIAAAMGVELPESWETDGEVLTQVGWSEHPWAMTHIGDEYGLHVTLYSAKKGDAFLADFGFNDSYGYWILLDDLGEAVSFLNYLLPLIKNQRDQDRFIFVRRSIAHRIEHDPEDCCHQCESFVERFDREERQKRRQERKVAERKATENGSS
jgi:hypothetical protein